MTTTPAIAPRTPAAATPISETFTDELRTENVIAFTNATGRVGFEAANAQSDVCLLQYLLHDLGYPVPCDGTIASDDVDDPTIAALHEFQCNAGLPPTGVVDTATRTALGRYVRQHPPLWIDAVRRGDLGPYLPSVVSPGADRWRHISSPYEVGAEIVDDFRRADNPGAPDGFRARAIVRTVFFPLYALAGSASSLMNLAERLLDVANDEARDFGTRLAAGFAWLLSLLSVICFALPSLIAFLATQIFEAPFRETGLPDAGIDSENTRARIAERRKLAHSRRAADLHATTEAPGSLGDPTPAPLMLAAPRGV